MESFRFPDPGTTNSGYQGPSPGISPKTPGVDGNGSIKPVFWSHDRSDSQRSIPLARGITLEDHTESPSESSSALWAKGITVGDHVVVRGSVAAVGAYVVWNCKVETLDGGPIFMRKRYSEFEKLHDDLAMAFPKTKHGLPALPPKNYLQRFQPRFLEKRRSGLSYFLNCVLLNPEFAGSPIVKDFIFARDE